MRLPNAGISQDRDELKVLGAQQILHEFLLAVRSRAAVAPLALERGQGGAEHPYRMVYGEEHVTLRLESLGVHHPLGPLRVPTDVMLKRHRNVLSRPRGAG